jgi:hypothetical protein
MDHPRWFWLTLLMSFTIASAVLVGNVTAMMRYRRRRVDKHCTEPGP